MRHVIIQFCTVIDKTGRYGSDDAAANKQRAACQQAKIIGLWIVKGY